MLKKQIIKKITISSAILFSILLVCIMPNNKFDNNIKQELNYVEDNLNKENIYLLDSNNYLARTSVVIDTDNTTLKAKELIDILINNSSSENKIPSGFRGIIPSDTKLLSLEVNNDLIKVNFDKNLLDVKEEYEEKIVEAIVYTLTSIDKIKKVIIYVEGEILSKLPKSKINIPSTLDRSYGINKEYNLKSYKDISKVTVYYLKENNNDYYYVPVTKYLNDSRDKIEIIIEELSKSNNNLLSYMNQDVEVIDKKIEDQKLYLVFNDSIFENKDERNISKEVIETLSLSIKDNYDIEEVVFEYNNKEILKSVVKTIE